MDRILAIDDNPQILKLVTVNLQARNFIVQTGWFRRRSHRSIQNRAVQPHPSRSYFAWN